MEPYMDSLASINLDPPEPTLYAKALDALIELWLDAALNSASPETVKGYRYKIAYFRRWWAEVGPAVQWQLTKRLLIEFELWLRTVEGDRVTKLSYHSRNDVMRRVAAMFTWAAQNEYTARDYGDWLPVVTGSPPKRRAARLDELERLFEVARTYRDRCILALLIGTGIRRSECASLQVEMVRLYADGSGVATVIGKRTRANKTGEREVAIDIATGYHVRLHLDFCRYPDGPLFRSHYGTRIGKALRPQGIYNVVKRCLRRAGLHHIVGPHDLRRAFATHMARLHRDETHADLLRRQMGHSSYKMTATYTLLEIEDIRDDFVSPLHWVAPGDGQPRGVT
jgi:integrase